MLVTKSHQANEPVEVSIDKEELKLIPAVANHPSLSDEANWYMSSVIYKHADSNARLAAGFKSDFTETVQVPLKSGMAGGDNYELHEILVSGVNRSPLISVKRADILNASTMDLILSGGINPLSPYESAILSNNPYFYYRFNESSGTSIADSSGSNRGATVAVPGNIIYNNPGPIAGGKSLLFNQTRLVTDFSTDIDSPISIEWWFKGTDGGNMIAHWTGEGVTSWNILPYFSLRFAAGNVQAYYLNGYNMNNLVGPEPVNSQYEATALTNNTWHHVVYTQSSNKRVLYLDGIAVDTKTDNFAAISLQAPWHIGGWGSNLSEAFNGYIAEVAFYKSELSAANVLAHYQAAF